MSASRALEMAPLRVITSTKPMKGTTTPAPKPSKCRRQNPALKLQVPHHHFQRTKSRFYHQKIPPKRAPNRLDREGGGGCCYLTSKNKNPKIKRIETLKRLKIQIEDVV